MTKMVTDSFKISSKKRKTLNQIAFETFRFQPGDEYHGLSKISTDGVPLRFRPTPVMLTEICLNNLDKQPLPDAFHWTSDEVLTWIENLGFPQYKEAFISNHINGRSLVRIDASALVAMNIKNFDHIKAITKSIRDIYKMEITSNVKSNTNVVPQSPQDIFKFHKSSSGYKYDISRPSDIWNQMQITPMSPHSDSHWECLEKYLKHSEDFPRKKVAFSPRRKLYRPQKYFKDNIKTETENENIKKSSCEYIPLNQSSWKDNHYRKTWDVLVIKKTKPRDKSTNYNFTNFPDVPNSVTDISWDTKPRFCPECESSRDNNKSHSHKIPKSLNVLRLNFAQKYIIPKKSSRN